MADDDVVVVVVTEVDSVELAGIAGRIFEMPLPAAPFQSDGDIVCLQSIKAHPRYDTH